MLLGLPPYHLHGVALLHSIDLDLLDDHVTAANGDYYFLGLDPSGLKEAADGIRDHTGIHDLALDYRVGEDGSNCHPAQDRLALGVVDLDELDQPAANVQGNRRF